LSSKLPNEEKKNQRPGETAGDMDKLLGTAGDMQGIEGTGIEGGIEQTE
jgi:hypothetical protein